MASLGELHARAEQIIDGVRQSEVVASQNFANQLDGTIAYFNGSPDRTQAAAREYAALFDVSNADAKQTVVNTMAAIGNTVAMFGTATAAVKQSCEDQLPQLATHLENLSRLYTAQQ